VIVGVVGAGTMGAGIAQLAALSGARTLLADADPGALAGGLQRIRVDLRRGVERGQWDAPRAQAAAGAVTGVDAVAQLADCDVVVEAVPERLALKREVLAEVGAHVGERCVLATNTSSLTVTAIAAGVPRPQRIVGMHFFNPAPRMRLVEVVAGDATGEEALGVAVALGEAMGQRVVRAADTIGFLVNRVSRPFGLEALRLVTERIAQPDQVDRIVRLGGGFRMGPFELADVVGLDVGLDIARSFYEQSFGEPRWRPSPLSARMVAAGRLGRKTRRGWYAYGDGPHRAPDPPEPVPAREVGGLVVVAGDVPIAHELRLLADDAGWDLRAPDEVDGEVPTLIVDCGALEDDGPLQGGPQALLLAEGSLARLDPGGSGVGFHALPPLDPGGLVELAGARDTSAHARQATEGFFASLGLHTAWVGDAPGLVLGRIVAQLVNEAAFALGEGIGAPDDLDDGMVLGLHHPRGPLEWGDLIGLDHVLAILDALHDELGEERYRAAPLLRRLVAEGRTGVMAGEGFHRHD
jgi:3-hydroxybutyryl-CoA dehydrogenase